MIFKYLRLYKHFLWFILLFVGAQKAVIGQYKESNTFKNIQVFENEVPSTWKTNGKGTLETTDYRKKQGLQSLLWTWEKGAKLIVTEPTIATASYERNMGLKLWIYSEADISDSILIVFYNSSNQIDCSFFYKINFKGWRGMWIHFESDMGRQGRSTKLTHMEINAPASVSTGRLFFDVFEIGLIRYLRSPSHQFAAPHVTNSDFVVGVENQPYVYEKLFPNATIPQISPVTMEEKNDLDLIRKRIDNWLFGTNTYVDDPFYKKRYSALNSYILNGVNNFKKQNIVREPDGRITGPGLFAGFSDHGPKFGTDFAQNFMIPLALDFRLNGNETSKENLILLFDYFYDQGFAAGSAIETLNNVRLRMVGWVYAVYLMQEELKKELWEDGKTKFEREIETMRWMILFNVIFAPDDFRLGISVDDWRSTLLFQLLFITMMDDSNPQKVQYMKHYQKWLDRNLVITYGWEGGIKPDGLGYHHRGPYLSAYTNHGVHIVSQIAYFLRHTLFDLNQQSKENIKYFLMNYRTISHLYDIPKGISGRGIGFDVGATMISSFAYMSKSMNSGSIDTTLARAMIRLWNPSHEPVDRQIGLVHSSLMFTNSLGQMEAILDVIKEGFDSEPSPTGFWSKPYAAMALFRGDDWMVSVKGTSSYVWDYETGSQENDFGRYDSHGQMEIINNLLPYPALWRSGHDYQTGWDWGKVPGTTSIDYPNSEIPHNDHRIYSDNKTVGAVMHRNRNGVWAMDYEDNNYGSGLKFKKSVFFFGTNQMVCLGSDIISNEPLKTITTLHQNVISSSNASFTINGMLMPPNYWFRPQNGCKIIKNSLGLGIYIPDASNLHIIRTQQSSNTVIGNKSSSGDVFTAWFDNSSKNDYEYVVLMDGDNEVLQQMSNKPNYKILEQSSKAHIVEYLPDSITGFAIFDNTVTFEKSWIRNSSRPVLAMVDKTGTDEYTLSICDPDFNRPKLSNTFASLQGPYNPTTLELTLTGLWQLDGTYDFAKQISVSKDQSIIQFTCFDAKSYEVKLIHSPLTKTKDFVYPVINIFPNPGNGLFKASDNISGKVFDIYGRCIMKIEDTNSINLAEYPSGLYFLNWTCRQNSGTTRLVNQMKNIKF